MNDSGNIFCAKCGTVWCSCIPQKPALPGDGERQAVRVDVSREWCEAAAQAEAEAGDPDPTTGRPGDGERPSEAERIADAVVSRLFVNGMGEQADRLVLTVDRPYRDLGGWCRGAVRDVVIDALRSPSPALDVAPGDGKRPSGKLSCCSSQEVLSSGVTVLCGLAEGHLGSHEGMAGGHRWFWNAHAHGIMKDRHPTTGKPLAHRPLSPAPDVTPGDGERPSGQAGLCVGAVVRTKSGEVCELAYQAVDHRGQYWATTKGCAVDADDVALVYVPSPAPDGQREAFARFMALRADLHTAIGAALARDGHCKPYEGLMSIVAPNFFDVASKNPNGWAVTLDCYVVGPSRHYTWTGATLEDAVTKAEADVRAWIAESAEELKG
ncbi:MAG: hypothetical protein AB7O67_23330 [Vicinamibacterales bacterium]